MTFNPILYEHIIDYRPIKRFTILGERHSGTNWIERIVLSRLELELTWEFGSKHFIKNTNWTTLNKGHDVLFICITRNIYDWIHGFYKLPHHVGSNIKCDKYKFMLSQWDSGQEDYNFINNKPYENIFHMRKSKLEFYIDFLPNIIYNMIIIRYEDLLINPENIVSFISDKFGIPKTNKEYGRMTSPRYKQPYKIKSDIFDIISNNTDWITECRFNYFPRLK